MDLISRQAAIDVLNIGAELLRRVLDDTDVVGHERQKYEWGLGLIEAYIADLKDLPSAQPMRKKGKWTREVLGSTSGYGTTVVYQCSECESMSINKYHYCQVCGAEMMEDDYEID